MEELNKFLKIGGAKVYNIRVEEILQFWLFGLLVSE
jgi:hypothetical protein